MDSFFSFTLIGLAMDFFASTGIGALCIVVGEKRGVNELGLTGKQGPYLKDGAVGPQDQTNLHDWDLLLLKFRMVTGVLAR